MPSAEIDDRARAPAQAAAPTARQLRMVVAASASGTGFEWYDFFVFGSLTSVMSKIFFAEADETAAFIFYLLVFAAGFFVRPLGALVFGHFGDRLGRKGAFIVTITLMGLATCGIGLLPTYAQAGTWAPIGLVTLRCIQGFALGGEYGGAAIYVAEHAPPGQRGYLTGWIQTSASFGLAAALIVILAARTLLGESAFAAWGWRIPFLVSIGLLVISLWIRLRLEESPLFRRIKAEGSVSRAPLAESFFRWQNLQLVLIALGGLMAAQGVIWYTAHFYAQFFLERVLKVAPATVNEILIIVGRRQRAALRFLRLAVRQGGAQAVDGGRPSALPRSASSRRSKSSPKRRTRRSPAPMHPRPSSWSPTPPLVHCSSIPRARRSSRPLAMSPRARSRARA